MRGVRVPEGMKANLRKGIHHGDRVPLKDKLHRGNKVILNIKTDQENKDRSAKHETTERTGPIDWTGPMGQRVNKVEDAMEHQRNLIRQMHAVQERNLTREVFQAQKRQQLRKKTSLLRSRLPKPVNRESGAGGRLARNN